MYSYTFDLETGGIILNSTPTNFSKEPRPVYAAEMDILGFDKHWDYEKQNEVPYMWAESNFYWYRGVQIAKTKGGGLYTAPELIIADDLHETNPYWKQGTKLIPIDIGAMCAINKDLLTVIEDSTVKKIVKEYEKFKDKLDIFHVAFSGGKDSAVLLDLVKKALPKGSFVVIFGDTGMEFPDTYITVEETKKQCETDGTPFYIARSHFDPKDSWKLFGPPARVLRWCCSVHKSTPQTLKMREITGKDDYIGMDFVGVRAHESLARSKYDYENLGKKQRGQYSFNPILEWTSAEVWLYIFLNRLNINAAYKKGNSRAGCLLCPMGGGRGDYLQHTCYPDEVGSYINMIKSMNGRNKGDDVALASYVANGGWNARKNGRDLIMGEVRYCETIKNGKVQIEVTAPKTDWKEWIKTIGKIPFQYEIAEKENGLMIGACYRFLLLFLRGRCLFIRAGLSVLSLFCCPGSSFSCGTLSIDAVNVGQNSGAFGLDCGPLVGWNSFFGRPHLLNFDCPLLITGRNLSNLSLFLFGCGALAKRINRLLNGVLLTAKSLHLHLELGNLFRRFVSIGASLFDCVLCIFELAFDFADSSGRNRNLGSC